MVLDCPSLGVGHARDLLEGGLLGFLLVAKMVLKRLCPRRMMVGFLL